MMPALEKIVDGAVLLMLMSLVQIIRESIQAVQARAKARQAQGLDPYKE